MARGVLPLALGHATKLVPHVMDGLKEYIADIRFGVQTDTLDAEGEAEARTDTLPTHAQLEEALPQFEGDIQQVPPIYSALKIGGRRAYDIARAGGDAQMRPRKVHVEKLELQQFDGTSARIYIKCGKGTYVRSLARDIALACGSLGHLTSLERTRVGFFSKEASIYMEKMEEMVYKNAGLEGILQPMEAALDDIPVLHISSEMARDIGFGRSVESGDMSGTAALLHDGKLLAIAECEGGIAKPKRVFIN